MTDETKNTLEQIRDEITGEADYNDEYVDADIAKGLYRAVVQNEIDVISM